MRRDVVDVIEKSAVVVSWLTSRILTANAESRAFLFAELANAIYAHLVATKTLIEPRLNEHLPFHQTPDIYADVSARLAELITDTTEGPMFERRLRELAAHLSTLRQAEAQLTLPALELYLSKDERAMLGAEFELQMERFAGRTSTTLERGKPIFGPRRSFDEARLVLGG